MFMRFRGGGVGHLGTLYLDWGLKKNNHESGDEQQVKVTFAATVCMKIAIHIRTRNRAIAPRKTQGRAKSTQVGENIAMRKTKKTRTRTQTMSTRRWEHKRLVRP